jgi:beta-glucosidase
MRARERGAPVDGYFVWSFLDNLEWRAGYSQRFGIVWVDHDTQQRILKDSAYWYRDRIAQNSAD